LVIGAAGWGKTTAVVAWSRGRRTASLRYDDHEGVADRLLSGLVTALQAVAPPPTADTAVPVPDSVAALCAWLQSVLSHDLVVVLDDLHELQPGSAAAAVVQDLCRLAPDRLHLVLMSRRELPFSLQRLRGRGLVAEIHAPDLAFDIADVDALLRITVGSDPAGLARRVWEGTDGWAAAVRCAVEMLRTVPVDQRLDALDLLCRRGERFHGYLAEEVLGAEPEWVQQLLRRIAIFGDSATELGHGSHDPTTVLAELSRQGHVRRGAENRPAWLLVRPLRDYFEHEAAPSSSERKALHLTAANECLDRAAPADALRHLVAAGDHAGCIALLTDYGGAIVDSGHVDAVLEVAELPAQYLEDPGIQQVLGHAQQVRGQWAQALHHFHRAGYGRGEVAPALAWRVGMIAFAQGEFGEVHALVDRARFDQEDTLDEIRVLALAGSAYRMTGDLGGLRKMAARADAAARRCGEPRAGSSVAHLFVLLAAAEGDWRQANAYFTEALRIAEADDDLLQATWMRACRAFHQFEAGEPRQALAQAQSALSSSERCKNPLFIAHALTTRGRAHARLGVLDAAATDFATAIDLFQSIGSRLLAWPLCGLGDLYRTRNQLIRARAAYEEALALAEPNHDVFGLSSALIGLARIGAADDLELARELAGRAGELGEGLRKVPALLACGWVELMGGDRRRASAYADRAALAARQRRDNLGLAEAITLSVLASSHPEVLATTLHEAIDIWQESDCRLEEAETRVAAVRIGAPIPRLDGYLAEQVLRDCGIDDESRRAAGPLGVLARSAPPTFIQTLGVFRVLHNGLPVPNIAWKSKKARDLLKILVARRRSTPRGQLMELLWPGVEPAVAGNRLSVLLSTLRDVLQPYPTGEDPLITTDGAVAINPAQVSVDVEEFLTRATAALDANRAQEPDVIARLKGALAAHTGDFLEEDSYQEWAVGPVESVRATYFALLRALSARLSTAGDTDAVVRYTLRLLEQDCYNEEAYLTLVGILFGAGRLGEAHRHYQTYVRRMAEIDVVPSPLPDMTSRGDLGHTP
ncbi:MAG: BTAD domain-containing putative transcriptional regulator, partial [Pseudonocardiaceae bacterium]